MSYKHNPAAEAAEARREREAERKLDHAAEQRRRQQRTTQYLAFVALLQADTVQA